MIERLLIAGIVLLLIVLFARLVRAWDRRRCARIAASESFFPVPTDDLPQIVTFVGANCTACDRQKRINNELESILPATARFRYIDAVTDASLALSYGVIVVPTTLVISSSGRIVSMTSGVLPGDQLTHYLSEASSMLA